MESAVQAGAVALKRKRLESERKREAPTEIPPYGVIYEEYFGFVWRSAKRLGTADGSLEDAVQDVLLVVHCRLPGFEGRSSIKTWLFGIVLNTVRGYRRSEQRKPTSLLVSEGVADTSPDSRPESLASATEAVRLLYGLLDGLDQEKREVFVQAELEQMTAREIAKAVDISINTVYSRLRAAKKAFNQAVVRLRARDGWRYG